MYQIARQQHKVEHQSKRSVKRSLSALEVRQWIIFFFGLLVAAGGTMTDNGIQMVIFGLLGGGIAVLALGCALDAVAMEQ